MKTTMIYGLLFLTLLGLGISCKKEVEPIDDVQSSVYPPGCQIARIIYKNSSYSRKPEDTFNPEIITLADGSKIKVSLVDTTYFVYDTQSRLIESRIQGPREFYYSFRYTYTTNTLIIYGKYFSRFNSQNSSVFQNDTLILNDQGFVLYQGTNKNLRPLAYNQAGQLINRYGNPAPELANQYENGNLMWTVDLQRLVYINGANVEKADRTIAYKYDLTRPNIPSFRQYIGKQSRNLPVEELTSVYDLNGPVHRKTYTYTFDQRGRVKRRISSGEGLNPAWLIAGDTESLLDYEYQNCP
jgi:hypothetical protein